MSSLIKVTSKHDGNVVLVNSDEIQTVERVPASVAKAATPGSPAIAAVPAIPGRPSRAAVEGRAAIPEVKDAHGNIIAPAIEEVPALPALPEVPDSPEYPARDAIPPMPAKVAQAESSIIHFVNGSILAIVETQDQVMALKPTA
jgi:hypothetical protein